LTGMVALTESHLTCHTYPEHQTATFNLYCCRTRPEWDWEAGLLDAIGAKAVRVTKFERGQAEDLKSEISNPKSNAAGGDA
jgi:S-adenosylmethionine decarboxylase